MPHFSKKYLILFYFIFLQIGYYDPFVNAHRLGLTKVNEWGVFNYLSVDQFNYDETWLLQKEHRMNQFPLTFSVFFRYPSMFFYHSSFVNKTSAIYRAPRKFGIFGIDGFILANMAEILEGGYY